MIVSFSLISQVFCFYLTENLCTQSIDIKNTKALNADNKYLFGVKTDLCIRS